MAKIPSDENPLFETIELISDEAVAEQGNLGLGMDVWAQIVAGVATGTSGPFTIGLFAKWGRGKTSVLQGACNLASFEENTHAFIVNAWEHERHPDPLQPIMADVLRAIDRKLDATETPVKHKRLNGLKKILTMVTLGASALALGAPALALAAPQAAEALVETGKAIKDAKDQIGQVNDAVKALPEGEEASASNSYGTGLRAMLTGAKSAYMPDEKIVIFIDDLDRCHPDKAVLILESIKHLLWVPGFIFVLALDNEIIEKYLQKRYAREYGLRDDPNIGKKYLEKLIQLTLFLPESPKQFEDFVRAVLQTKEGKWLLPESLVPILVKSAETSPRQAKRRINDLIVDTRIFSKLSTATDTPTQYELEEIAACMAVNRLFKDIFSEVEIRALSSNKELKVAILKAIDTGKYLTGRSGIEEEIIRYFESAGARLKDDGDYEIPKIVSSGLVSEILKVFEDRELWSLVEEKSPVRAWFSNDELRKATREFLVESRGVEAEVSQTQREIIEAAIRKSLKLGSEVSVGAEHYKSVTDLDFAYVLLDSDGLTLISRFKKLTKLTIDGSRVSDLMPIKELQSLEELSFDGIGVSDLTPIKELQNLIELSFNSTKVSDLTPIKKLQNLKDLYFDGAQVSDLTPLKELEKLRTLSFDGTGVSDLSPIKELQNLTYLSMYNIHVSDYEPLFGLHKLEDLYLPKSTSKEQLDALKKALPKCQIIVEAD